MCSAVKEGLLSHFQSYTEWIFQKQFKGGIVMKKQLTLISLGVLFLAVLLSPCGCWGQQTAKPIELSLSYFMPPVNCASVELERWVKEIAQKTNGRVKIISYPSGSLTPGPEEYDGAVMGISDLACTCLAYSRGRFPLMEVTDLPLGYPSAAVATKVANGIYKKFKPAELADVHVIYLFATGPYHIHSKMPINNLEDIQGKKIRATGLSSKIVKNLGAVPVAMTNPEAYDAIQKGVCAGSHTTVESLSCVKLSEVTDYTTEIYMGSTAFVFVMNLKKWNSLPKDIKQIFNEVSKFSLERMGKAWDKADLDARTLAITKHEHKFIPLDKKELARWHGRGKPLLDQYIINMEAKNLPGKEALEEANRLVELYSK
jgi:TRAP-type C4-dicarboxylate transport system substrate-binding protein